MSSKSIYIFLCTPRCATQWFAKNLGELYSDKAEVVHEPIGYYLRANMGRLDANHQLKENELLEEHLNYIEKVSESKTYIEINWQGIAAIPKFYNRFGNRLKLVHLYRNPINVAASLVTNRFYTGEIEYRAEMAEITPFDKGAKLKEYSGIWDELNLFEKCLYFWTEVNFSALAITNWYHHIPSYSIKFENVFNTNKEVSRVYLNELLAFLGLEYKEELIVRLGSKFDNYRYKTTKNIDWTDIYSHPQTIELATKLGYDLTKNTDMNRYVVPKSIRLKKFSIEKLKKVYSILLRLKP